MKPLHLIDYAGRVRPGRATLETITDVLEGRESDRLATVTLDADGAVVVAPLDAVGLDALRLDLTERRRVALRAALDSALALIQATDGIPGVNASSMFSGVVSIDVGESPWAEDVALAWAHERQIPIEGTPPPSGGRWERRADLRVSDRSYSPIVATMRWPTVTITTDELVARDAEESGHPEVAAVLRAGDRQSIAVVAAEEPF